MKNRNGFVSNSSSSSFIIDTNKLSNLQLDNILDYQNKIEELLKNDPDYLRSINVEYFDNIKWNMELKHEGPVHELHCSTFMDNFDLLEWVLFCGVKKEDIHLINIHNPDQVLQCLFTYKSKIAEVENELVF